MDSWIFYFLLWARIQYYITYFVVKLFQLWPLRALSVWLQCPFDMHHPFLCMFLYFLALKDVSCSFWIFPAQPQNQSFLQGALVPFIGKWYYKSQSGPKCPKKLTSLFLCRLFGKLNVSIWMNARGILASHTYSTWCYLLVGCLLLLSRRRWLLKSTFQR